MRLRPLGVLTALVVLVGCGSSSVPHSNAPGSSPTAVRSVAQGIKVACLNDATKDVPALQTAIRKAERQNGAVSIAAGTCALDARLPITGPVTIGGAGQHATFLVQHARMNIFQITASDVTIENLNLDTGTFNASAPILKNPNPGVLFTKADRTTVTNVIANAGSGYGMRFVGPEPCATDQRSGDVINDVNITTTGKGGFAAIDVSCQNGATVSNITIHGGILALYRDRNVTVRGETFTPGPFAQACAPPWYITGPAQDITIDKVTTAGGQGIVRQSTSNIAVTNQTVTNHACP